MEWFMDLGAADPTYILPACVTLGFLAVTEIGMDGIQMQARAAAAVFGGVLFVADSLRVFTLRSPRDLS